MIREIFCLFFVLIASIIPSAKMHNFASELVEKTFVISEPKEDNMTSQAVKVFSNSEALKEVIAAKNSSYNCKSFKEQDT